MLRRLGSLLAVLAAVALPAPATRSAQTSPPATPQVATPNPHGSFKQDCALCHRAESWVPAKSPTDFDHSKTGFPLEGSHQDVPCLLCHTSLEFAETSGSRCADCHQDVHQGEMGIDCARCHTTRDFIDRAEAVRQHRVGRFPLTGAHLTTDCAACHRPQGGSAMRFAGTAETCAGCHLADYQAAKSPDHVAGGYSTDCARCHSTSSFSGGTFDHSATAFPLTGAHVGVQCAACHGEGPPGRIASDCVSCHRADYDATTAPAHAAVGFPTDCARCHGTASWDGASFDHAVTGFALTGRHAGAECAACHGTGPIGSLSPECVGCHRGEYDATTDPPHAGAGFPTDCAACHGTSGWGGATFDHDGLYFPIYSGAHRGKWSSCADCHVSPANYSAFECILCHEHSNQSEVDRDHRGESGYSYNSAACYRCHPDGRH